jgi:capsular exopolysaccharide synthesis family protein
MNPNAPPETTGLREQLAVLRARRGLVIAVTLIAIAIGVAYVVVKKPTYDATATVTFTNPATTLGIVTPGTQVVPDLNPEKTAAADTRIVTRDDVVTAVQSQLNNGMTTSELKDAVNATVQPDSNQVGITASTDKAEKSAAVANAFALQTKAAAQADARNKYTSDAKQLKAGLKAGGLDDTTKVAYETAIARLDTLSKVADPVDITRPASVPGSPASPKPARDIILAAILGLLLGIGAAFLRNALDRRVKDSNQIQSELGIPLVGYVRADALGLAGVGRNGDSFVSEDDLEAFRILRTNVDFLAGEDGITSLVVTSALPEEGKSTVAAWFAYVSAVAGRRTLLVECDLRRPVLATRFGVEKTPGLSDYLAGEAKPKEVLRSVNVHGREAADVLPLIPAGENTFQPTEMIGSQKFKNFVKQTTSAYDMVIFDSAPLLPVGDTLQLIPQVDAVLLCVRLGQTTRDQAQAAKEAMRHLPDKPTGLVVTGVKRGSDDDYYGYYSYAGGSAPARAG